jgi:hypothetical protein
MLNHKFHHPHQAQDSFPWPEHNVGMQVECRGAYRVVFKPDEGTSATDITCQFALTRHFTKRRLHKFGFKQETKGKVKSSKDSL